MHKIVSFILALTVCSLMVFSPALQAKPPVPASKSLILKAGYKQLGLWYKFYWSGLFIGNMVVGVEENSKGEYLVRTSLESQGLVRALTSFYGRVHTRGQMLSENDYHPAVFRSRYSRREKHKSIGLHYAADGSIEERVYEPPLKLWKRDDVPEVQRDGKLDPLTLGLVTHKRVAKALVDGTTQLTIPFYDGRRLANLQVKVLGNAEITVSRKRMTGYRIELWREPIAGFSDNEMKRWDEEEPRLEIILSDDGRLLPIRITGTALAGMVVGHLNQVCNDFDACYEAAATD